jgi:hypothetical protein
MHFTLPVAVLLEARRHAAAHNTQANEPNFHFMASLQLITMVARYQRVQSLRPHDR